MKPSFWNTLGRSCRLRCPACGKGSVAKSWRETYDRCPECGFDLCVDSGFYLGSIYVNYGICVVLLAVIGTPLVLLGYLSLGTACILGAILATLFSIYFFRYARSLWLGLDYYLDRSVRSAHTPLSTTDEDLVDLRSRYVDSDDEPADNCACPLCRSWFPVSKRYISTWGSCAFCGERILLLPAGVDQAEPTSPQKSNGNPTSEPAA